MPIQRFPRWELTKEEKLVWELLRYKYNQLARRRDVRKGNRWDIYAMKVGLRAKYAFLLLTPHLVEQDIDPGLFIKVMCQYGHFKRSTTMPHPIFLASPKAMEVFTWLVKKDRELYGLKTEWDQNLEGRLTRGQTYAAVKSGARIFKEARKQLGVNSSQTFLAIFKDLSPAFVAAYLRESKAWRPVLECLTVYRKKKELWISARRAIRSEFKSN